MSKVILLRTENNRLFIDQKMLPSSWSEGPVEGIVKHHLILLKPVSLSQRMRGVVKQLLSYEQLEEIYSQR